MYTTLGCNKAGRLFSYPRTEEWKKAVEEFGIDPNADPFCTTIPFTLYARMA